MPDAQFFLAGPITEKSVPPLLQAIGERVDKGVRSILLALTSPGGNVFWGLAAYNYLRGLGIPITTHNLGQADSIASVVFCAGDRRLSAPHSRFLLHGVSTFFPGTDTTLSEVDLVARLADVAQNRELVSSILATRTGRPLKTVKADLLKGIILTALQAQAYGLVTAIREGVFEPDQEVVRIIVP